MMSTVKFPKMIHAARRQSPGGTVQYLFLRKRGERDFTWYEELQEGENETSFAASTVGEAMQLARRQWKQDSFRTVHCGFRYTLPERDEHGCNALFHQMIASYNISNGVYFDEELGHNCIVQAASQEALYLWKRLKQEGRL